VLFSSVRNLITPLLARRNFGEDLREVCSVPRCGEYVTESYGQVGQRARSCSVFAALLSPVSQSQLASLLLLFSDLADLPARCFSCLFSTTPRRCACCTAKRSTAS
jgi:hypothetical protein